jgi:hypothetical protein
VWWKLSHHQSLDGTHLCWNQLFIHSFTLTKFFVIFFFFDELNELLVESNKKGDGGHLIFWHPPKQNGGFVPNRMWHTNREENYSNSPSVSVFCYRHFFSLAPIYSCVWCYARLTAIGLIEQVVGLPEGSH